MSDHSSGEYGWVDGLKDRIEAEWEDAASLGDLDEWFHCKNLVLSLIDKWGKA